MHENFSKIKKDMTKRKVDLVKTLEDFAEKNQIKWEDLKKSYLKICLAKGHPQIVEAIVNTFLLQDDEKKHCVFLLGNASTGKSTVCRMMQKIFVTQKAAINQGHFLTTSNEQETDTQLLVMEEVNWPAMLSKDQFKHVLGLLDGSGSSFKPNLYEKYAYTYAGVFTLIASNDDPFKRFTKSNSTAEQTVMLPLETRWNKVDLPPRT